MFCYQCEQTAKSVACTVKGVCGKDDEVASLQDALVYALKGLALVAEKAAPEASCRPTPIRSWPRASS